MFSKEYSIKKHEQIGQLYDGYNYSIHLMDVASRVKKMKFKFPDDIEEDEKIKFRTVLLDASFLHDVIEDTKTTKETLYMLFDEDTVDIVDLVTDSEGDSRIERKRKTNERFKLYSVKDHNELRALILKPNDRISNWEYAINKDKGFIRNEKLKKSILLSLNRSTKKKSLKRKKKTKLKILKAQYIKNFNVLSVRPTDFYHTIEVKKIKIVRAEYLPNFKALNTISINFITKEENKIRKQNKKVIKMYFNEYKDFKESTYRENLIEEVWEQLDNSYEWVKKNTNIKK